MRGLGSLRCLVDKMYSIPLSYVKLLGKRTLIIGGVGSGKTEFTSLVIREWMKRYSSGELTIIDLAPRYGNIGRGVDEYIDVSGLNYLTSLNLKAPRLMARDESMMLNYTYINYVEAMKLFEKYFESPTEILVINDLSIYLHYGEPEYIVELMRFPKTFLANSYYGWGITREFSRDLDMLERRRVERLFQHIDVLIKM